MYGKIPLSEGAIDEELYKSIDSEAKQEAKKSVTFAEESPFPEVSDITKDVYYEVDEGTQSEKQVAISFIINSN